LKEITNKDIQEEIKIRPPIGVIGPNTETHDPIPSIVFNDNKYIEPENKITPANINLIGQRNLMFNRSVSNASTKILRPW
jgi:hypothetical protein